MQAGAIAAALLLSSCRPARDVEVPNATVSTDTTSVPRLTAVEAPLDRAAILRAAADAASAAALGRDDREAQGRFDGDRYEVRIRFGCSTPDSSAVAAPFVVQYDEESRRLQVRASPDLDENEPWIAALAGDKVEAVEGFWMRKPWMLASGCSVDPKPVASENTEDTGEPTQAMPAVKRNEWRVGIAQFFGATDTRTTRRDNRAYETTKTLAEDRPASLQGYDLVLSGRLRELSDGRVIACHVVSPELPPECVASVTFDQVKIQRADTQETLAEWSS
jgi:hypothetical protein